MLDWLIMLMASTYIHFRFLILFDFFLPEYRKEIRLPLRI